MSEAEQNTPSVVDTTAMNDPTVNAPTDDTPAKKRGNPANLQGWRTFSKAFKEKHCEKCKGKSASWVSKHAGIAWRHKKGKKRESDPLQPEMLLD